MKENIDIEKLFKDKFENFEPDVDPQLWTNISQSIGSGATTGTVTGGMSAILKTALISGGIIAAGFTGIYFGTQNGEPENNQPPVNEISENLIDEENVEKDSLIKVENINDPVIIEHREEIERELANKQYDNEVDDESLNENIAINEEPLDISIDDSEVFTENDDNASTEEINDGGATDNVESIDNNDTEKIYPTGRLEYKPVTGFAPVAIKFSSNAKNYNSVKWNFGDGTTGTGTSVEHTYPRPGEYTVSMKVFGDGNVYEESKQITIKSNSSIDNIPNVITPDGDRINDFFFVKTSEIKTFFISIRDVNGNVIFESNDKEFEWDGTNMMGEKVKNGTYIYTIYAEGNDGSVFKIPGQLSVYR